MDQRRLLLGVGLSVLLLFLYNEFVMSKYASKTGDLPAPTTPRPLPEAPASPTTVSDARPEAGPLVVPADVVADVTVETEMARTGITTVGGRLISLELKRFRESVDPLSPALNLVRKGPILPLTVEFADGTSDALVQYQVDRTSFVVRGQERAEVVLRGRGPAGQALEKRLVFTGDRYDAEVHVRVTAGVVGPSITLLLPALPAEVGSGQESNELGIALADGRLVEKAAAELAKEPLTVKGPRWAGFSTQYFVGAAIALCAGSDARLGGLAPGASVVRMSCPTVGGGGDFSVFLGPKEREELTRAGHELRRALDFGWFWFVAVPLLVALRAIHAVTGNYGVAIIALTTAVKVATMPLTQSTFRNMREMQKLKPHMDRLRERFKDDQVALQREMMDLYKRHRVNPFSGCVPMLLQLPIFVGLYNTLSHAIELRHAPFLLWINDLSAPDRLMFGGIGIPVLTLLMGGSMFLQQWLTPQQGDPTQQRMMLIMPVIFTYMFIGFPAGLVLYWLVNNVLTIGQQYVMLRSSE